MPFVNWRPLPVPCSGVACQITLEENRYYYLERWLWPSLIYLLAFHELSGRWLSGGTWILNYNMSLTLHFSRCIFTAFNSNVGKSLPITYIQYYNLILCRCHKKRCWRDYRPYQQCRRLCYASRSLGNWQFIWVWKVPILEDRFITAFLQIHSALIGGWLARPHDHFPETFPGQFWSNNPYFLPCAMLAVVVVMGLATTAAYLNEVGKKNHW